MSKIENNIVHSFDAGGGMDLIGGAEARAFQRMAYTKEAPLWQHSELYRPYETALDFLLEKHRDRVERLENGEEAGKNPLVVVQDNGPVGSGKESRTVEALYMLTHDSDPDDDSLDGGNRQIREKVQELEVLLGRSLRIKCINSPMAVWEVKETQEMSRLTRVGYFSRAEVDTTNVGIKRLFEKAEDLEPDLITLEVPGLYTFDESVIDSEAGVNGIWPFGLDLSIELVQRMDPESPTYDPDFQVIFYNNIPEWTIVKKVMTMRRALAQATTGEERKVEAIKNNTRYDNVDQGDIRFNPWGNDAAAEKVEWPAVIHASYNWDNILAAQDPEELRSHDIDELPESVTFESITRARRYCSGEDLEFLRKVFIARALYIRKVLNIPEENYIVFYNTPLTGITIPIPREEVYYDEQNPANDRAMKRIPGFIKNPQ